MKAKKGEWFSLKWEPLDYYDDTSFFELKKCPKFFCVEENTNSITQVLESMYPKLRLTSINLTTIFIKHTEGFNVPTHYRIGEFMPGDNTKYDAWLKEFYNLNNEVSEQIKSSNMLQQKTIYLEHTAKVIRHDMHSGINTYIPRGLNLLIERLDENTIKTKKLQIPIKLLTEGLKHTQRVYEGVYAFTNLVKKKSQVEKIECDLKEILEDFLESSSYKNNVVIDDLGKKIVNSSLFCNAINNFVKNGIAYNDSKDKLVKIYLRDNDELIIEDNGRGLTQYEYYLQCMPFIKSDEEEISGMGINIANAILEEHGFSVLVEEIKNGTRLVIKT
jgi:light-regulated signal transduction histidine kinase (bacteriophytochrome)